MAVSFCQKCGMQLSSREIAQGEAMQVGDAFVCKNCMPAVADGPASQASVQGQASPVELEPPAMPAPEQEHKLAIESALDRVIGGQTGVPDAHGRQDQAHPTQVADDAPPPAAPSPPERHDPEKHRAAQRERAAAADGNEVVCPNCAIRLRAPAGVPRFRCSNCREIIERELPAEPGAAMAAPGSPSPGAPPSSPEPQPFLEMPMQSSFIQRDSAQDSLHKDQEVMTSSEMLRRQRSRETFLAKVKEVQSASGSTMAVEKKMIMLALGVAVMLALLSMFVPQIGDLATRAGSRIQESLQAWF